MLLSHFWTSSHDCQVSLLFVHWILYWSFFVCWFILEFNIFSKCHFLCSFSVSSFLITISLFFCDVFFSLTFSYLKYEFSFLKQTQSVWKVLNILHVSDSFNMIMCVSTLITEKKFLNLSSSFFTDFSVFTFFVFIHISSLILYLDTTNQYWFTYFSCVFCIKIMLDFTKFRIFWNLSAIEFTLKNSSQDILKICNKHEKNDSTLILKWKS